MAATARCSRATVPSARHNLGLDAVRSLAILAVIASHVPNWWGPPGPRTDELAAYIGLAGVECFFSLSGFLIGGILLRAIDAGLGARALGRFWLRRWMRTVPAYWALLIGLGCYLACLGVAFQGWRSLVFLQNFVPQTQWVLFTSATWSLVLEEWFYLFVPLLLLGGVALTRGARWAPPFVLVCLIVACTAARAQVGVQPSPVWGADPTINPILRLDCASWGILAVWFIRFRPMSRPAAFVVLALGVCLLAAFGWLWMTLFTPEVLAPFGYDVWGPMRQPMQPTVLEGAAALVVLGVHRLLPTARGSVAWAVGALAALSYSLYLVHVPTLYLGRLAGLDDTANWFNRVGLVTFMLSSALVLRYAVEWPMLVLRDRFVPA